MVRRSDRSGFIWGALLLLLAVLGIALFQSDLTRNATRWTARTLAAEAALAGANTDLEEQLAQFVRESNEPGTATFERMRSLREPQALTLDAAAAAPAPVLWAGAPAIALAPVSRSARIAAREALSGDPREWNGLAVLRACVRARVSFPSSVDRELEDVREVRVARLTAPAPFDLFEFYFGS